MPYVVLVITTQYSTACEQSTGLQRNNTQSFNCKGNVVTRVVLPLLTFLPFVYFIFYWPHVSGF